jgi:hypothetical protein
MVLSSISQHKEVINQTYGLGWFIEAYRGYRYLHHGGFRLSISVPGQQTRILEPYKETEFPTLDLAGYSSRFVVDEDNQVTEMQLIQPNGVFTAKRKE